MQDPKYQVYENNIIIRELVLHNLPVGGHQDFNISTGVKSIQLINQFQHGSLHLIITTCTIIKSGSSNSINFIKKDDACFLCASHFKEFSNHTGSLTDILLNQFGTDDSDKCSVSSVGD